MRKMVLVPADSQTGGAGETSTDTSIDTIPTDNLVIEKKRIERSPEKIQKLLRIALKIASINAFNENFEINDLNGIPIPNSDITKLLNNAISAQKILVGEKDFIRLLHEANVDPNWIVNENLRSKLLNYRPTLKRKLDKKTDEVSKKSKNSWDIPLPDDDDDL